MSRINEKIQLNNKLNILLCKNIKILELCYPFNQYLKQVSINNHIFEKPNNNAFHHLSYYFINIITVNNGCNVKTDLIKQQIYEIKYQQTYKQQLVQFVQQLNKEHNNHITNIIQSYLAHAGGYKITKLMFELSQIAIKTHVQNKYPQLNLDLQNYDTVDTTNIQQRTTNKISQWRKYTFNMNKIAELLLEKIPIIEGKKESKQILLKSLVQKVTSSEIANELTDIFSPSNFLKIWGEDIDKETEQLGEIWDAHCKPIVEKSKKCRERSEQLIKMHLKKSNKDYVLEFDENVDSLISLPFENDLSISQSAILKSVVKDGVLNLPNFFKAYGIILSHCFEKYIPNNDVSEFYQCAINDKRNIIMVIKEKSVDLVDEVYKFHNKLKDGLDVQASSCFSVNTSGILDVLNIPSIVAQSVTTSDCMDYWQKSLEKYKFTEFKHPYKTEKTYYITEKDPSFNNISRINSSVIKKGFFSSSKETQIQRKMEAKPEYLKNIEELERNMCKISDVRNNTFAHPHNMTMMGRIGTERRQSIFNQTNHMKYLLTSIKKKTSVPELHKHDIDQPFDKYNKKTWSNLFNETLNHNHNNTRSFLQKTQSSPNLASENDETKSMSRIIKPTSERISGVKEIDYSSFLSDIGSMPNLHDGNKENLPENHEPVITETILVEHKIEVTDLCSNATSEKKEMSPNKRKSVESLIDTYKKFKESRGLGAKSNDEKLKSNYNSKHLTDSFLEKLDLGDNKRVIKNDSDVSRLSAVPDLLSPSLQIS